MAGLLELGPYHYYQGKRGSSKNYNSWSHKGAGANQFIHYWFLESKGLGAGANQHVHWFLGGKGLGVGVNQHVHSFFGGKGLGIQQGMSV